MIKMHTISKQNPVHAGIMNFFIAFSLAEYTITKVCKIKFQDVIFNNEEAMDLVSCSMPEPNKGINRSDAKKITIEKTRNKDPIITSSLLTKSFPSLSPSFLITLIKMGMKDIDITCWTRIAKALGIRTLTLYASAMGDVPKTLPT